MGKGETGYIASNIQQEQHGFSLLGGGKISAEFLFTSDQNNGTWSLSQESCTTYIIHSIFLWFGDVYKRQEFDLLTFLAEQPNHVFTKEELFREIWDMDSIGDIATVTVHILSLIHIFIPIGIHT